MNRYSLLVLFCLAALLPVRAQEQPKKKGTDLNTVVNTLKERLLIQGYVQTGYTYDSSGDGSNTFDIKRAILMVDGKITDQWRVYFMYNFGGTSRVLETYTEYKFHPAFVVRFGQFKTAYTVENQLSPTVLELISCNSQATNYLAGYDGSDPLYGTTTGRDMGLMIHGQLFNDFVSYNLAVMNGQGLNTRDRNKQKDVVGKLMLHPTQWLSVGGSFVKGKGCAVATSAVNPDIQVGDSYTRDRWAVSGTVKTKPFELRTEYLAGKDGKVKSRGYYATCDFHVLPKFDIVASYDFFNKNTGTDDKQTNYVAGLQYWFYPRCRVQAQYTYRDSHLGKNSSLIQAQVQVRF